MKANCFYSMAMAALVAVGVSGRLAGADPVVVGDPGKGTPIATVKDGKANVKITTTGISVEKTEDAETNATGTGGTAGKNEFKVKGTLSGLADVLVPGMFFAFLIAVILGGRYIASRNEQKRLDVLRLMVEKGQPVPEAIVSQILNSQVAPDKDSSRQNFKRTRNAYAFTIAGLGLLGYVILRSDYSNSGALLAGLIFLCLGAGGIAGLYLPKQNEKTSN